MTHTIEIPKETREEIMRSVAKHDRIKIKGLGFFTKTKRKRRKYIVHPRSGEKVKEKTLVNLSFKPYQPLKDLINKKR